MVGDIRGQCLGSVTVVVGDLVILSSTSCGGLEITSPAFSNCPSEMAPEKRVSSRSFGTGSLIWDDQFGISSQASWTELELANLWGNLLVIPGLHGLRSS